MGMSTSGNPSSVVVWWTPICGYMHVETDPVTVPAHCPDDSTDDDGSTTEPEA